MGILAKLLSRGRMGFDAATPENPTFDLNSDEAWDALGAERSITGESVSAESALSFSPWFRGVSILSRDVAKTPLYVYKYQRGGSDLKEIDADHGAYHLLRWKPNDYQTAFHFRQALVGHAVNRGNGYALITRDEFGVEPVSLDLLDPDAIEPVRTPRGALWYVIKLPSGEERKIPGADIFHLRGFGFDGITGYPAYSLAKDIIGVGKAQLKYKGSRFKNAARPSLFLEAPGKVDTNTRKEFRKDWEAMHTGLENAHRTAILDAGMKANRISFTAEEMQEIEQAGLTINDVSNILGVPASKLGNSSAVKYKSKEDDDLSYLTDGLDYWFFAFEDESRDKLFTEKQKKKETHCVIFDRKSLIRADLTAKTNYWTRALGGMPWAVVDEAREDFDLDPLGTKVSTELQPPLNMGQGGVKNDPTSPNTPAKATAEAAIAGEAMSVQALTEILSSIETLGVNDAAKSLLADTSRRMISRLGEKGRRAAAKKPADYLEWFDGLAVDDVTRAAFAPVSQLLGSLRFNSAESAADLVVAELRAALASTPNATAATLAEVVSSALDSAAVSVPAKVIDRIWSKA